MVNSFIYMGGGGVVNLGGKLKFYLVNYLKFLDLIFFWFLYMYLFFILIYIKIDMLNLNFKNKI